MASFPALGAINVPVATIWSEPGIKRPYDTLILGAVTNPQAWSNGLNTEMRLWLVDRADTQALLGEQLLILEEQDNWLKVALKSQEKPQNEQGYPGWLPRVQVSTDPDYANIRKNHPVAVVAVPLTKLYSDRLLSNIVYELSYQTRLPIMAENSLSIAVCLPNGSIGYLNRSDIKREQDLLFSQSSIVNEARQFNVLRYLWSGTSAYGFDCSGLTLRVYQSQGISIPRDACDQALRGQPVDKKDLLPGDLLFFANDAGQGRIHHVAMYTENNIMIHAPNSRSSVREERFDVGKYAEEYWGARRYRLDET